MEGAKGLSMIKLDNRAERAAVAAMYVLFMFGGLWHVLGLFQTAMRILAAPLIMGVAAVLFVHVLGLAEIQSKTAFVWWALIVTAAGWFAEFAGTRTGIPFGAYSYGRELFPHIWGVPAAIGTAWFSICMSSLIITRSIFSRTGLGTGTSVWAVPVLSGLLMVGFDAVMEMAAVRLGYWAWDAAYVPVMNYIAWFVLGTGFSALFVKMKIQLKRPAALGVHAYVSQLAYFIIVLISNR